MIAIDHPSSMTTGSIRSEYVSWSQMWTFRQCPLKFRFRYLDRIEPEHVASSLLVGSSIHSAIEMLHRRQLAGEVVPDLDELVTEFWESWKERTEDSPVVRFNKSEDLNSIHELADRMLKAFLASDDSVVSSRVIGIEESLSEEVLEGERPLLGIIDLIYEDDGKVVIRDYKTSRSRWNQGNAEASAGQILLYGELVRKLLPNTPVSFEFVVISKAKSPTVERFEIEPSAKRLSRTKVVANRTLEAIETGLFYPVKTPMCSTCTYRSACAAWKG